MNTLCRAILMTVAGALVWLSIVVAVQSTPPPRDPCRLSSYDYGVVEVLTNLQMISFGWDAPVMCVSGTPTDDPITNGNHYVFEAETVGVAVTSTWAVTSSGPVPVAEGTNRYSIRAVYMDEQESQRDYLSIVNVKTPPVPTNLRIFHAGATATTGWFRAEFSKDWQDWQSVAWRAI